MSAKTRLDRRTVLRGLLGGAGVSIALPGLEGMLDGNGTAFADGTSIPKRFVVWSWGNGNDWERWTPSGSGASWTPSLTLQGLAPVKEYVSVVSGMKLPTRGRNNPHAEGNSGIMSGTNPLIHASFTGAGGDWNYMTFGAPSVDQVVAKQIGSTTPFKSLEVGATRPHPTTGPGEALGAISHNAPYNPNRYSYSPSDVFNRLFTRELPTAGSKPDPLPGIRASILDAVKQDAAALKIRLGAADRRRVDEHLEGVRVLEQRLKQLPTATAAGCKKPAAPVPVKGEAEVARVMGELVAMALACDLTRVVTFVFSSPASHVAYTAFPDPYICGSGPTSFHEYEHCTGFNDRVRSILKYFVDQFAVFLQTLKSVPAEAGGNLLDHACVLGTSEVANGWFHKHENYPLLVAGKASGALRSGLHVPIAGDAAAKNPARVVFTLLRAMNMPLAEWGADQYRTTSPVSELLAV